MNIAASINFDEPIHDSVQVNYFGACRVLELAHEMKKVEVLTHVSTAYAMAWMPHKSFIPEELRPWSTDHELFLKKVLAMNPQEAAENIRSLVNPFINTYALTKSMAE